MSVDVPPRRERDEATVRPHARRGDLASGLALAALGTYILWQSLGWEYLTPDGPGAGFFPRWYGIAIVVLSLALAIRAAVRSAAPNAVAPPGSTVRVLACCAALVACVLAMRTIGFFAAFALLYWFIGTVLFRQRQRSVVPLALAAALAFWLVFDVALSVGLPRSRWG